jgi:hypothetical protein
MTTHTITLARHTAQVVGLMGALVLGTWDSYGTEQLLLRHGPEWEGLAIDATFHNTPSDEGVTMLADTDGLVPVPPEACKQPSKYATITFRGVQDGVQRISCNLPYVVLDHAQVPGANSTATPSENAQALAQMQDLRDGAVNAKRHAEAARDDAAKSAVAAKESETNASQSATAAAKSAVAAKESETNAGQSATAAAKSAAAAKESETSAGQSATAAAKSAADAKNTLESIPADYRTLSGKVDENTSRISKLKEDTTALQKRQNVLVGSETGNPISCNDAYSAPLCGLTVYGKSTQDGTPSPDNPVPIVSAGDGGSVVVKVTGKNRMPPNLKSGNVVECFVKKNTPITLVFKGDFVSQGGNILFIGENNENLWFGIDAGKAEHHITLKANATKFQYLLNNTASENVCLTWNASSPDYEPYREQLLTLSTPNGLPGIPVTSGGNYTDQNGQQWVCDEVDLERGVKVQRITTIVFSDKKKFALRTTNTSTKFRFSAAADGLKTTNLPTADSSAFCSALALGTKDSTWTTPNTFTIGSDVELNVNLYVRFENINSLDELQQYLQRTPMSLTAILATPIETPLTPAEIAAYKALITYAPDTVVQASDGAGGKLEYQKDVNIAIKKLEDAIASMTTT